MPDLESRLQKLELQGQQVQAAVIKLQKEMEALVTTLRGDSSTMGLISKIHVVWHSYVWVLCTLSAAIGSVATFAAMKLFQ